MFFQHILKLSTVFALRISFQGKEETQPTGVLENYGFDFDSACYSPQTSCANDVPQVEEKSLENCMSMLQISDTIENVMKILYPILFLIFNIVYWLTFRKSF